ncbi:type IV pilin-like G/H family protein [Egbenema bharatensis]|uniref:type IV pilin-like G/H family protein n=1 Tax=Egbenema bharatensis TaxID=3463334 RepID=UPI003A88034D
MTTENGLDSAKQGNPVAIAALMNKTLQPKGITVTATTAGECLTIVAEAKTKPDQSTLVECIRQGLNSLNPKSIQRVVVQGKAAGQSHSSWRESFTLSPSSSSGTNGTNGSSRSTLTTLIQPKQAGKVLPLLNQFTQIRDIANTTLLAGIFLFLVVGAWSANRPNPGVWEYKVEGVEDLSFDYKMQQLGAEGWEVISARRAVSGEGSSSRGLYEVIVRRPTTQAQAQRNLKELERQSKELERQLEQTLARSVARSSIASINRAQQAYHIENGRFSPTIAGLDVGRDEETEHYTFSIVLEGTNKAIVTAIAQQADLKSYTGAVAVINRLTRSIVCESDSPSQTAPASPIVNGDELQCASGSSKAY